MAKKLRKVLAKKERRLLEGYTLVDILLLIAVIILLITILSFFFFSGIAAAQSGQFCYSGIACRGTEICETRTCIDFSGNISVEFVNCNSCGITTAICRDGGIASCQNTCQETTFGATCVPCNAQGECGRQSTGRPTAIVFITTFEVTALQMNITPPVYEVPAPTPVTYQVTVKNPLPVDLLLDTAGSFPTGWVAQLPGQIALKPGETKTFPVSVTPLPSSGPGTYNITIALVNTKLRIVQLASTLYIISSPNDPSITITPDSFTGTPGQLARFTVTVRNNDPDTFPPRIFTMDATAPAGWQLRVSSRTLSLRPGESRDISVEVVSNTTPDAGAHQIELRFASGDFRTTRFVSYVVTLCGDNICQVGEEQSCAADCPVTAIKCNPRCENEIDWGVRYSASVETLTTRFIVCNYGSTPAACEAAYNANNCGIGKPCLCGSALSTTCDVRCVDSKGAYYMLARSVGSTLLSANYSFTCPFVNLREIIDLRTAFTQSRIEFEKSQAAIEEILARTTNVTERAKYQPCLQGLGLIIDNVTAYTKFLDGVISFPGKQNTTQAREMADDVRVYIDNTFATYCKSTLGILKIDNVEPPGQTEVGRTASARLTIRNIGNVNYFGYAECDFISPTNKLSQQKTSCTLVPQTTTQFFTVSNLVNETGLWKLRCRIIGSLRSDCSSEIHDQTELLTFNTYSKEVFIRDVTASGLADRISCTVRTSRPAQCVGCRVGNVECTKSAQANETTNFECRSQLGNVPVTGYVYDTADCIAIEPKNKTAVVRVAGCGDDFVDTRTEQCEPPGNKNSVCKQDSFRCEGKKYGNRSSEGFCNEQCKCEIREEFTYQCVKDRCGAECSTGEVKPLPDGCALKCSDECTFVRDCAGQQSFVYDPETTAGSVRPGDTIFYQAVMKNIGTVQDEYRFNVTGNGKVLIGGRETPTIILDPNAQRNVVFAVKPNITTTGAKEITLLEIQSVKDGKRIVRYETTISQVTNVPPTISNVDNFPARVNVGGIVSFTADVADPDNDGITSALVCGDKDCTKIFCRLQFTGATGTCVYTTETQGQVEYYVRAVDSRDGLSISSSRSFTVDPLQQEVPPYQPPPETVVEDKEGSVIWNLVIIALLIILLVLAWYFRDDLKEYAYRFKIWWQYRLG